MQHRWRAVAVGDGEDEQSVTGGGSDIRFSPSLRTGCWLGTPTDQGGKGDFEHHDLNHYVTHYTLMIQGKHWGCSSVLRKVLVDDSHGAFSVKEKHIQPHYILQQSSSESVCCLVADSTGILWQITFSSSTISSLNGLKSHLITKGS